MRMFQPNAYISLDFSEGLAEVYRLQGDERADDPGGMTLGEIGVGERKRRIVYEQPEVKEVNALKHELELFAGAVRSRTRPVVSGEDARRALDVAQKIMHTIHEHTVSM